VNAGTDTVTAFATINASALASNPDQVTWTSGLHTTFLTLNPSPTGGTAGSPVTVIASLTDLSVNPAAPLSGESVSLSLDGDTCFASTDIAGIASCIVLPTTAKILNSERKEEHNKNDQEGLNFLTPRDSRIWRSY
jgi:hypothetical protein